jgi:hypothetical protein
METKWKVWKTIKIGTHENANAFCYVLKAAGIKMLSVNYELGQVKTAKRIKEIPLVRVSVGDLGFENEVTYREICKRALEQGLALCPAEVGLQLCWQYGEMPKIVSERIAMKLLTTIADERTKLKFIFVVKNNKYGPWLGTDVVSPQRMLYRPEFVFIFSLPKPNNKM